ncbi:MAG: hypothetical protein ACJA1A_000994 [Saprospiraceae bacterium]|jgi:hypothetical protein|tara:strand:- start:197 stop:1621 length:1425 start_codon:yes stop_codon:yes gene_type:complete
MKEDLTNKEIEIKDIADGMSFEIDTADLWANIEPNLPPIDDRKNRPLWWMAAGAFLMFTLLGGTYSYFSEDKITSSDKIEFALTQQTIASSKIEIEQKLTQPQESKPDKSSNVTQQKNSNLNKHTDTPITNYDDGHSHDRVDNSNNIKTKNVANVITVIQQPMTENSSSMRAVFEKETKLMEIIYNSPIQAIQKIAPPVEERSQLQGISALNMLALGKIENSNILSIPSPIIEPLKSDNWQTFWQFSSGINTSDNKISFIDEELTFDPQFDREQNLVGLSNSIHYGQENKNGWRAFGGLSHIRSTIRYSNFEELVFRTEETGVESKTIDQNGNEFETLGQITVTSITQNDIVWHRNHDYVNLEIGFGKRHSLLERLSLVTDVSAGYNIWSSHDGYYFEKENPTITKFTKSESHPYQNKGIALVGKLGIEYDLGNFSIGLSSNYNHGLGNATKSNNYYQIKNSHYGVQLGVVYRP